MIPGFNHNVKYKEKVYHIQTEDNGRENPYIVTHLFIGGNIIASKKTSYLDISLNENSHKIIEDMMKEQHKEMMRALLAGAYDDKLAQQPQPPAAHAPLPTDSGVKARSLDDIVLDFLKKDRA